MRIEITKNFYILYVSVLDREIKTYLEQFDDIEEASKFFWDLGAKCDDRQNYFIKEMNFEPVGDLK